MNTLMIENQAIRRPLWRRVVGSSVVNALAAPHGMSRYLEAIDPLLAVDTIRARVIEVRRETEAAVTLVMKPNGNWQGFVPGQYLGVTVEIDGVAHTRCYSLSGAPRKGVIQITVKRKPGGKVSPFINEQIRAGDVLTLSVAGGDFVLPAELPEKMLFIAGGSGITPMMSMLRTLFAAEREGKGYAGEVTLLYYNNRPADTIFGDELSQLAARHVNFRLIRVYSDSDLGEMKGLFAAEQLAATGLDLAVTPAWLCGPEPLMNLVEAHYAAQGFSQQLHLERFALPGMQANAADGIDGELRFLKSERYVAADGRSLLDQAEAAGLSPESGCRMGICHTCTCRKVSGSVRNLQTGEISSGPDEDIRICISAPVGDVTLDI